MRTGFIFTAIFALSTLNPSTSQITFTKLYDLEVGWSNFPLQFIQEENDIIVSIGHICFKDTINCLSIAKFNNSGELIENMVIENFKSGNVNPMIFNMDSIIYSAYNVSNGFLTQEILIGNYKTSTYNITEYFKDDGYHYWNNGILKHRGNYYTYGDSKKVGTGRTGTIYASIVKWDSTASRVLAVWRYKEGFVNHCYNLQSTPEGNLVFMNEARRDGEPTLYLITTIDTSGRVVDTYEMEYLRPGSTPRLLMDKFGNFYFNSTKDPRIRFHVTSGSVVKLNKNKDAIEWHLELPYNPFTDIRTYYISDFYEASNGDILTCGSIGYQDISDPSNGGTSGFIARVSPQGALLWLRMYRIPNLLYPDTRGYYRSAFLKQIKETASGQILCIGGANQREINGSISQELWILRTDSNGCVEGYDCDSVVILSAPPKEDYHVFVDTTLRWHELTRYLGNPNTTAYRMSSDSFLIGRYYYHNVMAGGKKGNRNWVQTRDYLREKDKKVWLNREGKEYPLYDFGLNKGDTFITPHSLSIDFDTLLVTDIDSVKLNDGSLRRRIVLKCLNAIGDCYRLMWIEGIGANCGIFNVENSCSEDFVRSINLLCFYQNDLLLWRDTIHTSCFITTATSNPKYNNNIVQVFPNPTQDILHIGSELTIEDISIIEQLSQSLSIIPDNTMMDVSGLPPGVYYLKIRLTGDRIVFKKFVKVD